MKRIEIGNMFECSGCGACVAVCPKNCLYMGKDELGFSVPEIDEAACIDCGRCLSVCPQQNKREFAPVDSPAYFFQSKNKEELRKSSSGGGISVIARRTLSKGGKVWGVTLNSEGIAEFTCIDSVVDLWRIQGSKYVEVKTPLNHALVKSQLDSGCHVMVSGLPCQIKGLRNYLGKRDYPNLLLVDLLCYGIQSPRMWRLYLDGVNPEKKSIARIAMRDKRWSWYDYSMHIIYDDGTEYKKVRWYDDWLLSYSRTVFNRESCSCCESKKFPRVSDMTLGDFWDADFYGLGKTGINKNKGVSVVFTHTPKGIAVFEDIKDEIVWESLPADYAKKLQKGYGSSVKFNKNRSQFIQMAISESFAQARSTYLESGLMFRLRKISRIYKKKLKLLLYPVSKSSFR